MLSLQLEDHTGKEWVTAFQVPCNPLRSHCCLSSHLWPSMHGKAAVLPWVLALKIGPRNWAKKVNACKEQETCPGTPSPPVLMAETGLLMLRTRPRRSWAGARTRCRRSRIPARPSLTTC